MSTLSKSNSKGKLNKIKAIIKRRKMSEKAIQELFQNEENINFVHKRNKSASLKKYEKKIKILIMALRKN